MHWGNHGTILWTGITCKKFLLFYVQLSLQVSCSLMALLVINKIKTRLRFFYKKNRFLTQYTCRLMCNAIRVHKQNPVVTLGRFWPLRRCSVSVNLLKRKTHDKNHFSYNAEWSSKNLWKMIFVDVKIPQNTSGYTRNLRIHLLYHGASNH